MLLWIALIFVLTAIAFVLALSSMSDFRIFATPGKKYSLFLIRNIAVLDSLILQQLHPLVIKDKSLISIERLFKGKESALVIFGPRDILLNFKDQLSLLELEEYSTIQTEDFNTWEMGIKPQVKLEVKKAFSEPLELLDNEQFWWQIVLQPVIDKKQQPFFYTQVRAVFLYANQQRSDEVAPKLQNLTQGFLVKIPKPFTKKQILQFYQKRSIGKDEYNPNLSSEDILKLFRINS